jgi:hypothetical protein
MDTATRNGPHTEIDTGAIVTIVDYLTNPRESRSITQIASNTALPKQDVKTALGALKEAAIVKSSGQGTRQKWWIDLELELPVELPEHLRPASEATDKAAADDDANEADGPADDTAVHRTEDEPTIEEDHPEIPPAEHESAEGSGESEDGNAPAIETDDNQAADEVLPDQADAEAPEPEPGEVDASTVEPPVRKSTGVIDPELAFPFHMLPVAEAAEGVTVGHLVGLTGMNSTRILKALWGMRQIGAAASTAPFHPGRGEWRRSPGAVLEQLAQIRMADTPARVACPDCGHDAALRHTAEAPHQTVATFDPESPAPEDLFDRDTHGREPQIMFCAMVLAGLGDAFPVELAIETGYDEATVLRALWALRACRLVECTEVQRPTGGRWEANASTTEGAPYARLADAPDALGCATCGHSLGTRSGTGAGKGAKGISREFTGDGGKPLPDGSLDAMIKAWAAAVVRGDCAEEQATCAGMRRLLSDQADAGVLQCWLEAWAESNPADPHARLVSQIKASLAEDNRPRSASAVKNALERVGKQKFSPILRVAGPVLTFRAKTSSAS